MATVKSDLVTLEEAGQVRPYVHGRTRTIDAVVTLASGSLDLNNVIQLCRVHTDSKILSIIVDSPDWGTTGDCDIGFYEVKHDGTLGAVIDVDAIADALDMNAAALSATEVRFSVNDRSTVNQQAWDLAAAVTSKPESKEMFLCMTVVEAGTITSGTIHVRVVVGEN